MMHFPKKSLEHLFHGMTDFCEVGKIIAIELSGKRTFMEAAEQEGKLKSASDVFFSVTNFDVSEEKLNSIYICCFLPSI